MGYSIIIADDEPKIIQLIQYLGRWEQLDITVVDTCTSGEAAYQSILAHHPDIVLTDIKMPVVDGLRLIEMVKEAGLTDINFVVISGYKHFEYARSAVSLGAVDYLLKPISEEQLNETLMKACKRIDTQRDQANDSRQLQRIRVAERQNRQNIFWRTLFQHDNAAFSSLLLEDFNARYGTDFSSQEFVVAQICVGLGEALAGAESPFAEKLVQFLDKTFGEDIRYCCTFQKEATYLILNPEHHVIPKLKRRLDYIYSYLQTLRETYGRFPVLISYSAVHKSIADLPIAFREMEAAGFGHLIYFNTHVLGYELFHELPRFTDTQILSDTERTQLKEDARYCREKSFLAIFDLLPQRAKSVQNASPVDMERFLWGLINDLLPFLAEEGDREALQLEIRIQFLTVCTSFSESILYLRQTFTKLLQQCYERLLRKKGKPIEDVKRYIEQYYAQPISLEDAAEYVGLTAPYLSNLFKSELNVGFNDYLTSVRIEHAKQLLINTNENVKEISLRVGYPDGNYFSKLFRKEVGIKPSEFRKLFAE